MVDNIESPAGYELLSGSKLESIPTPHNDLYRNHLNVNVRFVTDGLRKIGRE